MPHPAFGLALPGALRAVTSCSHQFLRAAHTSSCNTQRVSPGRQSKLEHILFPDTAKPAVSRELSQLLPEILTQPLLGMCSSAASLPSHQQTNPNLMLVSSMISKHYDSLKRQLKATEHPKIQMGTHSHISKCRQGREIKRLTFFFMAVLGITSLQRQQHCYTAPGPARRLHISLKLLSALSSVQTGISRPAAAQPGADSRCSVLRG